jgi:hypothetical protein
MKVAHDAGRFRELIQAREAEGLRLVKEEPNISAEEVIWLRNRSSGTKFSEYNSYSLEMKGS